jgi:threonine/homoserine/homoserine lactone efflux protein
MWIGSNPMEWKLELLAQTLCHLGSHTLLISSNSIRMLFRLTCFMWLCFFLIKLLKKFELMNF